MCGIAGFTTYHRSLGEDESKTQLLKKMGEAIAHRGPDASGEFCNASIGLAHRRLAIVDLTEAGVQPMHIGVPSQDNSDGNGVTSRPIKCRAENANYSIVFNGEIYNFLELRQELEARGVVFKSESDTEVILHLYEQYGTGCLERLNGMFAFALYDHEKDAVFLARDRLGKKPLYYHLSEQGDISFASEIKALLPMRDLRLTLNERSVHDFFTYQYVPDPYSIYNEIKKVPPAHYCWIDTKGHAIRSYWDLSFKQATSTQSQHETEQEASRRILEEINRATRQRMISDVPLGAFLSGGIDSGGIVATMVTQMKHGSVERSFSHKVKTCTIGFDNAEFNEAALAQQVAEHYETEHHELTLSESLTADLEKIAHFFDEPFADQSLLPTYHVSRIAREQVTVAVTGDGGDEAFAGYAKYAADQKENSVRRLLPLFGWRFLSANLKFLKRILPHRITTRAANFAESLAAGPAKGFFISNRFMTDDEWLQLAKNDLQQRLGNYHPSHYSLDAYKRADGPDHLSKILYTDVKTFLAGDILVKADRMSMANSLELRAPLLDYKVMEQAAATRSNLKINQGKLKYILKKTFSKMLPKQILTAKKRGFDIPLAEWLRGELKEFWEHKVLQSDAAIYRFFRFRAVEKFWQDHQEKRQDHSSLLWSMLMFELWYTRYGRYLSETDSNRAMPNDQELTKPHSTSADKGVAAA